MEGIESFAAVGARVEEGERENEQPIAINRFGMAYRSALPNAATQGRR